MNGATDRWVWTLLESPGCISCGVCADLCPEQAIRMAREMGYPEPVAGRCTGCHTCERECPVDSIALRPAG